MIVHSPIELNTLSDSPNIDIQQYKNPWQDFNCMSLPEGMQEQYESAHSNFIHLT